MVFYIMKEEFLMLSEDYPKPYQIKQVEYCEISDLDIPSGSGGINKEGYTFGQLRRQPIIQELVNNLYHPKVHQFAELCNQRNSQSAFKMYKVDGEYCFWNLRVGPIVCTPTEPDLRIILEQNSLTAEALEQKRVTPRMIRDITYDLLRREVALQCNVTVKQASHIIGNELDCAPHEDASGYIFMVPNWAHNWFRHDGYVSIILKELNR